MKKQYTVLYEGHFFFVKLKDQPSPVYFCLQCLHLTTNNFVSRKWPLFHPQNPSVNKYSERYNTVQGRNRLSLGEKSVQQWFREHTLCFVSLKNPPTPLYPCLQCLTSYQQILPFNVLSSLEALCQQTFSSEIQ